VKNKIKDEVFIFLSLESFQASALKLKIIEKLSKCQN